jgi:hypothetical protein
MNSLADVKSSEFESALTASAMKTLQTVQAAFMMGVLVFTAVIFITYGMHDDSADITDTTEIMNTLSIVHCAIAMGAYAAARFVYEARFKPGQLMRGLQLEPRDASGNITASTPAQKCIAIIRSALILRFALLQTAAFFGLVTCVAGVTSGVMASHPEYWANLISGAVLVTFGLATFPNRERVVRIFEERIRGAR